MSSIQVINMTLVVYSWVITLVITMCVLANKAKANRAHRLLVWILVCHVTVLASDGAAYIGGNIGGPFGGHLVLMANFLVYAFGYLLLAAFFNYLVKFLSARAAVPRWIANVLYALCAAGILLATLTLFNGMFFYTDAQNVYHRGEWFWLSQCIAGAAMLVNLLVIVAFRRAFTRTEFFFFLAYELLPVLAVVLQSTFDGPYFMNAAVTLAVLLLYVGIQVEQDRQLAQKDSELENSRISIMLSQIQPHFLYNALSAIAMLCDSEPAKAKRAIIDFSVYLRGNMDSLKQDTLIPFQKELEHTEIYLTLEKMRFGDDLNIKYQIEAKAFSLPPLTLQPLVENAVRYGVGNKEEGGTVTISATETVGEYLIIVADDGVGYDMYQTQYDGRTHIGIENVRKRLQAQCGGTLEIISHVGAGTTATIRVPKESGAVS